MTRLATAVLVVALSVAAAGCGSARPTASLQPGLDLRSPSQLPSLRADLRITKNVPCLNGHETLSGPDAVRRFRAVTAVMCSDGTRIYPGSGQWEVRVRKVAVSSVANLQQYFERHSVTTPPRGGICLTYADGIALPIFVDGGGRWLVPETPRDGCGHLLGFAGHEKGFLRVRWHVVSVHKIRLMISAPALAAHCAMQIKNLMYGWVGPGDQTRGGPLFSETPKVVKVCIYRTPAADLEVGNFVRGLALTASRTSQLLGAMTRAAPSGSCLDQRTFAVIETAPGREAVVELGGCWRVGRPYPNHGIGGANATVVRSLLGIG